MKRFILVLMVILIGCAGQQIPQDKPGDSTQCYESKFNIHRVADWEPIYGGDNVFYLKNPDIGELPDYVVVMVNSMGVILRYAYLDGRDVMTYIMVVKGGKACYVVEHLDDKYIKMLKKALLKCRNEQEV